MNGGRQALSLLSRCRNALRPTLSNSSLLQRCSTAEGHHRLLSSESSSKSGSDEEFPKLPLSAPMQFAMNVVQASFKQINWVVEQGIDRDEIFKTNETAEEIIIFATKCLAEENYSVLEEKFSTEALEKAKSIVSNLSLEQRKDLVFPGGTKKLWFNSELNLYCPWKFSATNNTLTIGYYALRVRGSGQTAWHVTLQIPRDGTSLSEDFTISDFFYEAYTYPHVEE